MSVDHDPNADLGPLDPRDYSRRTLLANERTYLAWLRTGLTTLTVALAIARVVPELADARHSWPYTALGVLFGLYGIFCTLYAERRRRAVDAAVRRAEFADADARITASLAVGAALLGVLVLLLVVLDS